jgi:penicillin-binding protein 1A
MAVLVGLPKAPSTYAPTRNYDISMGRANRVVTRMHVLGWIDDSTYAIALAESPKVYNDTLTKNKAPFIVDEVARIMRKKGIKDFKTGGYKVYTTIDLRLQNVAKESLKYGYDLALKRIEKDKIKDLEKLARAQKSGNEEFKLQDVNVSQLNGALVSLDSTTGDVLALVGSVDYKKSSYNRATQGRRQPGSAFKPFIYQVALNLGYSGATKLVDIAKTYTYEKNGEEMKWQPRNYEKDYKGLITLRDALVHSRNLATINLVNELGLNSLYKELQKFHIKDLPYNLSLSLGSMSVSPLELAQYYTAFSNKGVELKTHLILSITQKSKIVYKKTDTAYTVALPTQSFIMTTILKDVVKRGTGRRARVRGMEVAGKTGTTNNNVDAWFAGFSPSIETVIWFGNDDNTPMYHKETGGRVAGPVFSKYYGKVLKLYPQIKRKFDTPKGIVEVNIDGKKEYFSSISKPPRTEVEVDPQEELLW